MGGTRASSGLGALPSTITPDTHLFRHPWAVVMLPAMISSARSLSPTFLIYSMILVSPNTFFSYLSTGIFNPCPSHPLSLGLRLSLPLLGQETGLQDTLSINYLGRGLFRGFHIPSGPLTRFTANTPPHHNTSLLPVPLNRSRKSLRFRG